MNISLERIESHLRTLVEDIGPRPMGSSEDQMAMNYITGVLQEDGCEALFHEVTCPCWQHRSSSLVLLATGESLPAQGCQYSTACDTAGDVVPIKTLDEINNAPVAGRICLLPAGFPGGPTQMNIIALALEARGAEALIVDRNHAHPDAFDGKIVREPDLRRMPVACVSQNVAKRILASRSSLRLCIDAGFWHGHTFNIQGVIPGEGPGRVFLAAHHDTGAGSPGASDNGSGVAIQLEMARLFSSCPPPCELRFLFTGAHERLGQGAQDYVRDHAELFEDAVMELNFDCIGPTDGSPVVQVSAPETFAEKFGDSLSADCAWRVDTLDAGKIGGDA